MSGIGVCQADTPWVRGVLSHLTIAREMLLATLGRDW